MHTIRIVLLLLIFAQGAAGGVRPPRLFSGELHNEILKTDQPVRMLLIDYVRPNPTSGEPPVTHWAAVFMQRIGAAADPFLGFYYEAGEWNPQTQAFLFAPPYDPESGDLPTLQVRATTGNQLAGELSAPGIGRVGGLSLRQDPPLAPPPFPELAAPAPGSGSSASSGGCGAWDGRHEGFLRNHLTGGVERVSIRLMSVLLGGPQPPVRCAISGSADVLLEDGLPPLAGSLFPNVLILPDRPEQVLFADKKGDTILQLAQPVSGVIEGNWYSKRLGYIGPFRASLR